jgi:ABC-2 type transport system permease protein
LLLELYLANPMAVAVLAFQRAFWVAGDATAFPPDLGERLAVMALVGLVLLLLAHWAFSRLEGNFAQEL